MGTRGTVGFIIDGQRKSSYNHYDSYPSFLGVKTLEFVRSVVDPDSGVHRPVVEDLARKLKLVDEGETPTPEDLALIGTVYHQNVSAGADWYAYLRGTMGNPALILDSGFACGDNNFNAEEYDYIIDFDKDEFVVYEYGEHLKTFGFDKLPSDEEMSALGQ